MKIVLRNRRKFKDKQELTLEEFKNKYRKELDSAIDSYSRTRERKDMLKPPYMHINKDYEAEFYEDLRWNFNNNARSIYYIDIIK